MKNKITYLITLLFILSMNSIFAQNVPIDFETGGNGATWTWTVFENDTNPALEIIPNPDATGINTSATVAKFTALQGGQPYAGVESLHGGGIGTFTLDSSNCIVKIMVWKPVISDVGIKFARPDGGALPEIKVANTLTNQWEELTFDFSSRIGEPITIGQDQIIIFPDFDLSGRTQDNICYFDNITFSEKTPVINGTPEGTWRMAPQAGAFGVGPTRGDVSFFANSLDDVTTRACFFDDEYVFNQDGSFSNELGSETWVEGWQGGSDGCGAPVAPHDGSNSATWSYDEVAGTLTLNGTGAYLGIPKAVNGSELTDPNAAPASITYLVTSISETMMTLDIDVSSDGSLWWRFIMEKQSTTDIKEDIGVVPTVYTLKQNYPNPFNPSTSITFSIPEANNVKLVVYNLLGQKVATLVNQFVNAGSYNVNFDASNLSSGTYFYSITAGNFLSVKKMMLLK